VFRCLTDISSIHGFIHKVILYKLQRFILSCDDKRDDILHCANRGNYKNLPVVNHDANSRLILQLIKIIIIIIKFIANIL